MGVQRAQPSELGKPIIFRANAKFFGQKTAAKNEKCFCIYYTKKNGTEFIPSSETKCLKSRFLTNNYWVE